MVNLYDFCYWVGKNRKNITNERLYQLCVLCEVNYNRVLEELRGSTRYNKPRGENNYFPKLDKTKYKKLLRKKINSRKEEKVYLMNLNIRKENSKKLISLFNSVDNSYLEEINKVSEEKIEF